MRQDPGLDGDAQRLGQLGWLLFLRVIDRLYDQAKAINPSHRTPIPEAYQWKNWSRSNLENGAFLQFINTKLFPCLRSLSGDTKEACLIREVMRESQNSMRSGQLIRRVVELMETGLPLEGFSDRYALGDIYEILLSDLQSAGNAGEFYTPRPVTQLMADLVGVKSGDVVLDPACGTGGFLIAAVNAANAGSSHGQGNVIHVRGFEKKPLPHLLCITNLLLHGVDDPGEVLHTNPLEQAFGDITPAQKVDVILSNPPFGGMEEPGIENNAPENYRSRETADLFLLLSSMLLRERGRAAIILPDGFLFGTGVKARLRKMLLTEYCLHTVIRLPRGIFAPYTDINTNILFFSKGKQTDSVWFYKQDIPSGKSNYSKTNPVTHGDFDGLRRWWSKRSEDANSWRVTLDFLASRDFNLDIRNPHSTVSGDIDLRTQAKRYARIKTRVGQAVDRLKGELEKFVVTSSPALAPLVNNLDAATLAHKGIDELEQLILTLAMSGRLDTSRSTDSSVRSLLTKLGTSIPAGIEKAIAPYEVPSHWIWLRIVDVCTVVGGGTPQTSNPNYFAERGIAWLTPADLYGLKCKFISRGKRDLSPTGLSDSSAKLLPKGTVLFSSRAPIGYVAIAGHPLATNQGFKSCIPHVENMSEFLYYYLRSAARRIDKEASGTTFKEISGRAMQHIAVPVPPLEEQERIVKRLDALLEGTTVLRDLLEQATASAKSVMEAALQS